MNIDRHNMQFHSECAQTMQVPMPDESQLFDLAELFKIFGDSTRIRILSSLRAGEMCVGDLASFLGITQSAASHQLNMMKKTKLIKSRRNGKTVFYSLADEHVNTILDMGIEHVSE